MSSSKPLKNKTVLVTRPDQLSSSLLQRIKEAGGTALHYPVLLINDVKDSEELLSILDGLSSFDIAIFISPTAVNMTLNKINALPSQLTLAVIGKSTEKALNEFGYHPTILPADFNSESLLQHPELQENKVSGKSIVIFRGVGGRDLLGNTLFERGAKITYAETYRRDNNALESLNINILSSIDIITVTSNQGLQNLHDLTDESLRSTLTLIPIIVPSERVYRLAEHLGFTKIIQSRNATDDACMQSLADSFII